jgi:NAD(P)-dependent dehydrogenase (short-subunit alcohol dehydrogenase family)
MGKSAFSASMKANLVDLPLPGRWPRLFLECRAPASAEANWQPLARVGVPEDVAKAILYMVSDEALFMTGSVVVVEGGLTAQ